MTSTLSGCHQATLLSLSKKIEAEMGLAYAENSLEELAKRLQPAIKELGFTDAETCFASLITKPWTIERQNIIARALTIGETYFFRDPPLWRLLKNEILPGLFSNVNLTKRKISIWSAASSTGEEIYSMALTCMEISQSLTKFFIDFQATDINVKSLETARHGQYNRWSLRATPNEMLERYFKTDEHGKSLISQAVRDLVSFEQGNLISDTKLGVPPSAKFDIILCRNVLMYFDSATAVKVIARLASQLNENGWLVVSPCEVPLAPPDLIREIHPGVIVLRRAPDNSKKGESLLASTALTPLAIPPVLSSAFVANIPTAAAEIPSAPPAVLHEKIKPSTFQDALELMEKGDWREAAAILTHLIDAGNMSEEVVTATVTCFIATGSPSEALIALNKGISANPLNERLYFLKSNVQSEQDNLDGAIKTLRQALFLNPEYLMAHFTLYGLLRATQPNVAAVHVRNMERLLDSMPNENLIPDSGGLCAQQLKMIIASIGEK